jgi:hypothetical protein
VKGILGPWLVTAVILVAVSVNVCRICGATGTAGIDDGGNEAAPQPLPTSPATEPAPRHQDGGESVTASPHPTVPATDVGPDGDESGELGGGEILLVTPYVSESDIASINEAFSAGEDSPWGFEHRGIDFFPDGDLGPFQAVCSGVVATVDLWQLDTTSNWQVSVRIICDPTYAAIYAFEPMAAVEADGKSQLAHVAVSEGQSVAQGDIVGFLLAPNKGSHVDFGFYASGDPICPEPYFTPEARDSIVRLIRATWPGAKMCYN